MNIPDFIKRFLTKESLFIALLSIWITFTIQVRINSSKSENKILQIDEYNLGVACLIIKSSDNSSEKEIPIYQYDTILYKENLDFIYGKHRDLQVLILQNIAFMESSNLITQAGLLGMRTDIQEIKDKLKFLGGKIIENIKEYDIRLELINCDH